MYNMFVADFPFNQSQFESVTSVITPARDTIDSVSLVYKSNKLNFVSVIIVYVGGWN